MSAWSRSRARAQQATRVRLARFAPASRARAPSQPALIHTDTDLLARARGSAQGFVTVLETDFEHIEARLHAYLEANK